MRGEQDGFAENVGQEINSWASVRAWGGDQLVSQHRAARQELDEGRESMNTRQIVSDMQVMHVHSI